MHELIKNLQDRQLIWKDYNQQRKEVPLRQAILNW